MPIHYYIIRNGVPMDGEYERGADVERALVALRRVSADTYEVGEIIVDVSLRDDADDETPA